MNEDCTLCHEIFMSNLYQIFVHFDFKVFGVLRLSLQLTIENFIPPIKSFVD